MKRTSDRSPNNEWSAQNRPSALICFSHLRWGFVWQRPQHLLARLSRSFDVFFVEEPLYVEDLAQPKLRVDPKDGVTVLTPCFPRADQRNFGFDGSTNPKIARLLTPFFYERGLLEKNGTGPIVWYYTPMALGAAPDRLVPSAVVYDVMDELANFRGAPAQLREREASLFAQADVVFTGGPSLYESRKHRHPAISSFPSGVDAQHFAQTHPADELADLTRPIIGFYGVIDERMDLDLVAGIADLRPDWFVVMIGPVVKISEDDLPRRPNVVYLGKRDYEDLPSYLTCFDAAILPFALNDATRFISPTKTLEYLAAQKPVVSTPIRDVIDLYGSVVAIAESPSAFVTAIESMWSESPASRERRHRLAARLVTAHGWDTIARSMHAQIDAAIARRLTLQNRPLLTTVPLPQMVGTVETTMASNAD